MAHRIFEPVRRSAQSEVNRSHITRVANELADGVFATYPLRVRNLKTSIVVSTAMLAAAHAFATLEVAPTRNLQAAEAQAQETVKLSISGMV